MSFAKKVTLIPDISHTQYGGSIEEPIKSGTFSSDVEPKKDKIKAKIYDKIHRILKIIMKLARSTGYDEELRIKLKSGKYLDKSNVVDLITHAMSTGKILYGENEFIELLHMCNVDPLLIINENVKSKLIQFINKKNKTNNESQYEEQPKEIFKKRSISEVIDNSIEDSEEPEHKRAKHSESILEPAIINQNRKRKLSQNFEDIEDDQINPEDWDIPKD